MEPAAAWRRPKGLRNEVQALGTGEFLWPPNWLAPFGFRLIII